MSIGLDDFYVSEQLGGAVMILATWTGEIRSRIEGAAERRLHVLRSAQFNPEIHPRFQAVMEKISGGDGSLTGALATASDEECVRIAQEIVEIYLAHLPKVLPRG